MLRSASGGTASRDWTPVLSRRAELAPSSARYASSVSSLAAKASARRGGKRAKRVGGRKRRGKTGNVKASNPSEPWDGGTGNAPLGGITQTTTTTPEQTNAVVVAVADAADSNDTTISLEPLPGAHLHLPSGAESIRAVTQQPMRPTQPRKPASKATPRQRRRRRRKTNKKAEAQLMAQKADDAAAAAGLTLTTATANSELATTINNKPVVLSKGSVTLTHLDRMGKDYPRLVFQASWRSGQERGQSMHRNSRVLELDNGLSAERMDSLLTPQLKSHGKQPDDPLAFGGSPMAVHDTHHYGHQYIRHDAVRDDTAGDDDEEDRGDGAESHHLRHHPRHDHQQHNHNDTRAASTCDDEKEAAAEEEGETPQRLFSSSDSGSSSLSSDSSFGFLEAEMARDSRRDPIGGQGT